MSKHLLESLQLRGFLSFGPENQPVKLTGLNVLIGPNGVGKSNFIEAIELLHAAPSDIQLAIRLGGAPADWIWRGAPMAGTARIDAEISRLPRRRGLKYSLEFEAANGRIQIVNESLVDSKIPGANEGVRKIYYRLGNGLPGESALTKQQVNAALRAWGVPPKDVDTQQSILAQRRDSERYPELTKIGKQFDLIRLFRQWSFGRATALRSPQSANLPSDGLLPGLENLGHVLNEIEHGPQWFRFLEVMRKFFPRFTRLTTKISSGSVQIYLHEDGLSVPVPATRLSDGTLRFLALLAILIAPEPSPLICVDEPELGLHPDAMSILAELLVEASAKTQLIVTTHSDALVSALTGHTESVLVCEMGKTGTELQRLESAKLKHWLDKYRLGEVWRLGKVGGNLW